MKIAVIGAGLTGLTAAYELSQKGHQVIVFEKEKSAGGLAGGFKEKNWDWSLEYFFHHLFTSDKIIQNLIKKLGLAQKFLLSRPKTSIFYCQKISQFDSAFSLLNFPYLSVLDKLRTGVMTFYLKLVRYWQPFEKITAADWLQKHYGRKAYEILWQPLLESKFGGQTREISMAWFWARIKKRSSKLGYLEGGFQVLIDELVKKIKDNQGVILLNHEIKNLNQLKKEKFGRILFTTSTSVFLKIVSDLPKEAKEKLQKLEMIGAISLVLVLKEKFLVDNTYWLNINEPGFPFVAVVEHTNFIDSSHYDNKHLLYVGGYYPPNHRYFKMKKEEILKEFLPYLQKINPKFNLLYINCYLSANPFGQPIVPINYSKIIPSCKTPLAGVYLANMQQIYPWDRGMNYSVELGEKIANEIQKS